MAEKEKQVRYDLDGYDTITEALRQLLNQYPGLVPGDEITFSVLDEDAGKAMFPITGGIIETERESITGHVTQVCQYPFYVIYRVAGITEDRKAYIKEWLDNLGRWLEKQAVMILNEEYKLESYPHITGNRKILSINRQTPAFLDSTNENQSENWAIHISARYQYEFDK